MDQKPAATVVPSNRNRDSIYEPTREDIESEGRPLLEEHLRYLCREIMI